MAKKEEPIFTNANDYLFHCLDVLKADKGVSENTIIIMFMQYARLASNDGWVRYNWSNKASRPKESGRYEVYREGAKKQHYEVWEII